MKTPQLQTLLHMKGDEPFLVSSGIVFASAGVSVTAVSSSECWHVDKHSASVSKRFAFPCFERMN